jgi:hypothetical protein
MRAPILIASICLIAAACSPSASHIEPIYVSPQQYQPLSCEELGAEARRVAASAAAVAGAEPGSIDGGANVIIWPALTPAKASDETKSALARLKGEFDALVFAASQKNCGIDFKQSSA